VISWPSTFCSMSSSIRAFTWSSYFSGSNLSAAICSMSWTASLT